eukprot:550532_1
MSENDSEYDSDDSNNNFDVDEDTEDEYEGDSDDDYCKCFKSVQNRDIYLMYKIYVTIKHTNHRSSQMATNQDLKFWSIPDSDDDSDDDVQRIGDAENEPNITTSRDLRRYILDNGTTQYGDENYKKIYRAQIVQNCFPEMLHGITLNQIVKVIGKNNLETRKNAIKSHTLFCDTTTTTINPSEIIRGEYRTLSGNVIDEEKDFISVLDFDRCVNDMNRNSGKFKKFSCTKPYYKAAKIVGANILNTFKDTILLRKSVSMAQFYRNPPQTYQHILTGVIVPSDVLNSIPAHLQPNIKKYFKQMGYRGRNGWHVSPRRRLGCRWLGGTMECMSVQTWKLNDLCAMSGSDGFAMIAYGLFKNDYNDRQKRKLKILVECNRVIEYTRQEAHDAVKEQEIQRISNLHDEYGDSTYILNIHSIGNETVEKFKNEMG